MMRPEKNARNCGPHCVHRAHVGRFDETHLFFGLAAGGDETHWHGGAQESQVMLPRPY